MGVVFGSWPESLHSEFEQVKRIEAGRKLKKKVVSFNPDEQTMVNAGSAADPYECDLQTCTCADFGIRHLPCKHIYCFCPHRKCGISSSRPTPRSLKKKPGRHNLPGFCLCFRH